MATLVWWIVMLTLGWLALCVALSPFVWLMSVIDNAVHRRRLREGRAIRERLMAAESQLTGSAKLRSAR